MLDMCLFSVSIHLSKLMPGDVVKIQQMPVLTMWLLLVYSMV